MLSLKLNRWNRLVPLAAFYCAAGLAISSPEAHSSGGTPWDKILDSKANRSIRYGVALGGIGTATFERNADRVFAPASVAKVFIADSALRHLGPDYRFKTIVKWLESPSEPGVAYAMTIVGSGDPSWGMSEFNESQSTRAEAIAKDLLARNIRVIQGSIRAQGNDPRWLARTVPPGWEEEDLLNCDGARAEALNNDRNCAALHIRSSNTYRWESDRINTPVKMEVSFGKSTILKAERQNDGYVVRGTLGKKFNGATLFLQIPKSSGWVLREVGNSIYTAGIKIDPRPMDPPAGAVTKEITLESPPLQDLIRPYLKRSLNFIGDALYQEIGRVVGDRHAPDLRIAGIEVLNRDHGNWVELNDGSGLSRTSTTTPRKMYRYLLELAALPHFPYLWNALSIAAVDGTLGIRMIRTAAAGSFRGKTGTLDGTYNLAGFAPRYSSSGQLVALVPFVGFANAPVDLRRQARMTEDALVVEMYRSGGRLN